MTTGCLKTRLLAPVICRGVLSTVLQTERRKGTTYASVPNLDDAEGAGLSSSIRKTVCVYGATSTPMGQ
jgi:hypothetical protein